MSNRSFSNQSTKTQPLYACREDGGCAGEACACQPEMDTLQKQTGALLVGFGALFANSPLFRGHVDKSTAEMLVALGRKLNKK